MFQLDELIDPYRVSPSADLKENSNVFITENTFVQVDVKDY